MNSMLSVTPHHLSQLSPEHAVDVFREILWAEATAIGLGRSLIDVPTAIFAADGGVDAEVRDCPDTTGNGIICQGRTRYQIKTGNFSLRDSDIRELLLTTDRKELKPRIKSCLDDNGTFIVVLFGSDNPDRTDDAARTALRDRLVRFDERYASARIDVWRQNTLCGLLATFPSLALRINGNGGERFQTHRSWAHQDDMARRLQIDDEQQRVVTGLRDALRDARRATHVRVTGEPGIGKTRLVLEATSTDDLAPLVVYCTSPSDVRDGNLLNTITRDDNSMSVVLVVDECDHTRRAELWNRLRQCGSRIRLVTIDHEPDRSVGDTVHVVATPLSVAVIRAIIHDYGVPEDHTERWADLCSGSPRVAHVVGQNLRDNPHDLLSAPDTINVWERYVVGRDDASSDRVSHRRTVLQHLALFQKFGLRAPVANEAEAIVALIQDVAPEITFGRFQQIVRELRTRRILQGDHTLYISPKALHIKLWADWWDLHGENFDLSQFLERIPPQLSEWFFEMFRYAGAWPASSRVARRLLDPSELFDDEGRFRDESLARLFEAVAEAEPQEALRCLETTLGSWTDEQIRRLGAERRSLVRALERIAMWRGCFTPAASLLLRLAECEDEAYTNNATGVFAGLFSPAPGRVAPTEAPPDARFPVLRSAMHSSQSATRRIGLAACDSALQIGSFSRILGPEYQGLRKEPALWHPETYGELLDAYRRVWNLLLESAEKRDGDERQQVVELLLKHSQGLIQLENLADLVVDTLAFLAGSSYVDTNDVLVTVIRILRYDRARLRDAVVGRLEALRAQVAGSDFASLLSRCVGTDLWEDRVDDDGHPVDRKQQSLAQLAADAIRAPDLLRSQLHWLVTRRAKDGFRFGYELGKRDGRFQMLRELLEAQRAAGGDDSLVFFAGYLRALAERDPERWDEFLGELENEQRTAAWLPELLWRSDQLTAPWAHRLVALAERGLIEPSSFGRFVFGGAVSRLPGASVTEWIQYLLDTGYPDAPSIALSLAHQYTRHGLEALDAGILQKVLLHDSWFDSTTERSCTHDEKYSWAELAESLIEIDPRCGLHLLDALLADFGRSGVVSSGYRSPVAGILSKVAQSSPDEAWERISRVFEPPLGPDWPRLRDWLRGDVFSNQGGALLLFPREMIWRWVEEKVDPRAWLLACMIPKDLGSEDSYARELLIRFGDREDVQRGLRAHYASEGWSGPASIHYSRRKAYFEQMLEREDDPRVRRWLEEQVRLVQFDIERARLDEERRY